MRCTEKIKPFNRDNKKYFRDVAKTCGIYWKKNIEKQDPIKRYKAIEPRCNRVIDAGGKLHNIRVSKNNYQAI